MDRYSVPFLLVMCAPVAWILYSAVEKFGLIGVIVPAVGLSFVFIVIWAAGVNATKRWWPF